jgi:hypothetical protein
MAKKSSIKWFPFDKNGSLCEYVYTRYTQNQLDDPTLRKESEKDQYRPVFWKENYVFSANLTFTGFSFGRSSCRANFKDDKGAVYAMFISTFGNLMINDKIKGKTIYGNWTFAKRGTNYGLIEA